MSKMCIFSSKTIQGHKHRVLIINKCSNLAKRICMAFNLNGILIHVYLIPLHLCNSYLSCIFRIVVLVLYIFTNVFHASFGVSTSCICTIIESKTLTDSQYITFIAFSCHSLKFYKSATVGAPPNTGSCSSPLINAHTPFPIRKFVILNFHAWKLSFSSFSLTIVDRFSDILQSQNCDCKRNE